MESLAIDSVRACFPALERTRAQHPVAYFDGPGGTQVPRSVVEAMSEYLCHHNANTHWNYATSIETDEILLSARNSFADFFNASPEEVVFGANMTTLTYHVARALGRRLSRGDEVIITELDHHGNVGPWEALAVERGVSLRVVKMLPDTGQLDWDDFEAKVTPRTKVVAVGAASNALGTISDVLRAARLGHDAGAVVFVDGVHYAPHALPDVRALDCDFFICSAYKFYGPHVGVLFGKREVLDSTDFPRLRPASNDAPERAETGTLNHEGIAGAAAAVEFLASLGGSNGTSKGTSNGTRRERLRSAYEALHAHSIFLLKRLWSGLSEIEGVKLYGPHIDSPRTPTVAFTVQNMASSEVARQLSDHWGVFVSHGDFYAATVIERLQLGPEGLVRAGCACYTTEEEIDRLIEGVRHIARSCA
jgi:cysteine desulfurase family protein (TIGR01976 family)